MKLDYTYIKRLLTTMEEYPGHEIESYKFWELIGLFDSEKIIVMKCLINLSDI